MGQKRLAKRGRDDKQKGEVCLRRKRERLIGVPIREGKNVGSEGCGVTDITFGEKGE